MYPEPGQIVCVRARQYLVEGITLPPQAGEQARVRLSCLDDDAQGAPLEVLWESEVDAEVMGVRSWDAVATKGFDAPRLFSAYLHAQRWNCVTATDPKLFQAPYRAGIEVTPYQLEPLRKALLLPRVNLFIADDVGVGKTIEAGLILRELIMRQKVRRVVVAAPPSVVLQWRDELETRFGLTFVVFNRDYVMDRRRERGYGVNAWTTHSRFIISHALLRDEDYAAPLRAWLDEEPGGSLLILDEAHNAAPATSAKYAIDSKLTRTVRDLAHRFEHRLFLSATPHNGHLLELRRLHAAMDRAALDAYGWTDLQPTCEFLLDYEEEDDDEEEGGKRKKKPWRYRWPDQVRDEVLARLIALNQQRAEQEAAMGAGAGR